MEKCKMVLVFQQLETVEIIPVMRVGGIRKMMEGLNSNTI
jgi:hypothetical protein